MAVRALLRCSAPGVVLLLTAVAYASGLGNPFFGSDTWPWLVSTRVASAGDVVRVAFSPIMSGTSFVTEVAHFYHPLTSLTYSLDQALFGLNPFAFYATNLLIHLAAVGGLYSLARALGASWWAASTAALLLGLHPVAAATVPSLPRRQDLVVGALLVGSMSLLARGSSAPPMSKRWPLLGGAMALFVLALSGKEIAYAGVAVVPFVIACAWSAAGGSGYEPGRLLRASAPIVAGFLLLEAIAFAVRWSVLGGLGGYNGSAAAMGSTQGLVEFFVRPYLTDVLWPLHALMPERLRDWLAGLAAIVLVVGVAAAGLSRQRQLLVVTGMAWQAAFLSLYAVVHTSLSPYLTYVPLVGLALVASALLDGAADLVRPVNARRWASLTRPLVVLAVAGSGALLLGVLRTSALFTDYPEFRDAGSASKQFLDQTLPCLAAAPAGSVVDVDGLPHRIDYGTDESQFIDAYVFEAYSLESAVKVFAPEARAGVQVRSTQDVIARPPSVSVECAQAGGQWHVSVALQR